LSPNDRRREALLRHCIGLEPSCWPDVDDIGEWTEAAAQDRVIPLLFDLVSERLSDLIPAVEPAQIEVMGTMVRFEHDLLKVSSFLDHAGITSAVLKGFATAHLDYRCPELRQSADVDLLVLPEDLTRAIKVLNDLGWTQAYALPRHHQEFTHALTLRNDARVELDLHQRIAHRALGRLIPTDELLRDIRPFQVAGQTLWALSDANRMIHAALHNVTSRGPYSHLSSTADVLVLGNNHQGLASEVVRIADRWGVGQLVERSLRVSYAAASSPLPTSWESAFDDERAPQSRLIRWAHLSDRRRPVLEEVAYGRSMPSWSERRRYVAGYFSVDEDYAAQTGRAGASSQLRYLLERLASRDR
jgi:hypothetical protein